MGITNLICGGQNKSWPDSGTTYFNPRARYKSGEKPYTYNSSYGWYESINFVNWNPQRGDNWFFRVVLGWMSTWKPDNLDKCDLWIIWAYNANSKWGIYPLEEYVLTATINGANIDLTKDEAFKVNVLDKIRQPSLYRGNIDQVLDQLPKLKKERELILKQLS